MKTRIYKVNEENNDRILEEAGQILREGGLVAFPTETVYGLGADALNGEAAQKTYGAKGRPSDNPLIVHIAEMDALDRIVEEIPAKAKAIAEIYWPGPLTMVFRKRDIVPYGTTGGLETVAVRMPDHLLARKLITVGGGYISAPSANSSGRPSPTTATHVAEDLSGKIAAIVDGGSVEIGVESTILDMTVDPPMILRPGAITGKMLEAVIGSVQVDRTIVDAHSNEAPKAPGMKYRHYAPRATMTIVEGALNQCVLAIQVMVDEREKQGCKVGIIGTDETTANYKNGCVKSIGSRAKGESIAHNLYRVLRAFDEEDVEEIYCEAFDDVTIGDAIMNRLRKAAGQRVIRADEIVRSKKTKERGSKMIGIACDHGGYEMKLEIIKYLEEKGVAFQDFGCHGESVDYPIYARKVGTAIQEGVCNQGILICGTGIGISIAANKMKGIRCALCSDCFSAQATREHNDTNVLALGGRVIGAGLAVKIVDTFINTPFSNDERHLRRIEMIEE